VSGHTDAFRPFGWRVILEVLESIEIDSDDHGEPELPSMISDRDISKSVESVRFIRG
jgi:hypothetical protein